MKIVMVTAAVIFRVVVMKTLMLETHGDGDSHIGKRWIIFYFPSHLSPNLNFVGPAMLVSLDAYPALLKNVPNY